MSLQIAAQHLSSQGRGNDSMLVHMSPREVNSLNAIAKAHGGQLTINPKTGLAEAGFLESLLPMVAGAGLMAVSGGAINPMTAGLITGGLGYAMTGSLSKGLMMGLGAYGGAGLGSALAESGMQAAAIQPGMAAAPVAPVAPLPASIMTQPPPVTPLDVGVPKPFGPLEFTSAQPPAPVSMESLGYKPLTPAPNMVTTPAANAAYENSLANQKAAYEGGTFMDRLGTMGKGVSSLGSETGRSAFMTNLENVPGTFGSKTTMMSAAAPTVSEAMKPKPQEEEKADTDMGQRYAYDPGYVNPTPGASASGVEYAHLNPAYRKIDDTEAKKIYGFADGGATADPAAPPVPTSYTAAQPTTPISKPIPAFSIPAVNSMADLLRAPESQGLVNAYLNRPAPIKVKSQFNDYLKSTLKAKPMAVANSGLTAAKPVAKAGADSEYIYNANTQKYAKNPEYKDSKDSEEAAKKKKASRPVYTGDRGGMGASSIYAGNQKNLAAGGGISDAGYNLGGYSDGGRLLRGPGDGVSDSIPAVIGKKQPARLADGEFVVPARIVSELGNGSTEAGARKLYAMMDRIQKARGKTVGKGKVAKNSRSEKYLPA